jgi:hypothetical protein
MPTSYKPETVNEMPPATQNGFTDGISPVTSMFVSFVLSPHLFADICVFDVSQ